MAAHYHVEIDMDLVAFNPRGAVIADRVLFPEVDPCQIGARFSVYDEDGSPLINLELDGR